MSEPLPPLLDVIYAALKERGWTIAGSYYVDPEGNRYGNLDAAIMAQTFREIGAAAAE
jgi:hypothetical protein